MKQIHFTTTLLMLFVLGIAACDKDDPSTPIDMAARVMLTPAEATIGMSEAATLELRAEYIEDSVFAVSLEVEYDPLILRFGGYSTTDAAVFGSEAVEFVHDDTSVHIAFSRINTEASIYPNGLICVLVFEPVAVGQSVVSAPLASAVFYDRAGRPLAMDGLETVQSVVTVH
ncbi:MAG: hypothetical protein H6508_09670 [Calditrichaeota bacterium]|nr:hypothetical protein [Calditrichota bacterium]